MGREAPLFTSVTFGLDEGEKAALIGRNGSGKSTLLGCIAGKITPDDGTVATAKDCGISFLAQNPPFEPTDTIRDHLFKSESREMQIIREYDAACDQLAETGPQAANNRTQQKRLEELSLEMDRQNLWIHESRIRSVLTTLGIDNLKLKMGTLSGGMVKKVALAQVLIADTRLLLLDEPTNHLDITTISWLEDYLRNTDRTVLMVTHDRYFLDAVCTSIYELEHARLTLYTGNFSRYLEKKAVEEEIAANTDTRIESVLRTEREWLLRGPQARGTKAKARIDAIHRMINREKFAKDKGFSFEVTGRRLGGKILEVDSVSKSFATADGKKRQVISDFSYIFKKGEKIGIFGNNGSGKTTLLNLVTGTIEPDSGTVSTGVNTMFAYYRQNPAFPDTEQTVLEYIKETASVITMANGTEVSAAKLLELFGFEGKIQYSSVTTLSGGERKRIYLVRLLMSNPNFLILDEPTNDFDIYTMGVLESFLTGYTGCLLVVSHDRFFMDRVADTLFILEDDGSVSGFVGSCTEYIAVRAEQIAKQAASHAAEQRAATEKKATGLGKPDGSTTENRSSTAQKKRRSFREEKEYAEIESKITLLEDKKNELEALLSGGETDHVQLRSIAEEYESVNRQLEDKYARWEYLASFD